MREIAVFLEEEVYVRFVSVKDFGGAAEIWEALPQEQEMVITDEGKPVALLTPLNGKMPESAFPALRRARAVNAVTRMQEISAGLGNDKMTREEINAVIAYARKQAAYENSN
jgi:antitoxin (DNA-binding transcriptional repressor) of toxin-antitoxin stability system